MTMKRQTPAFKLADQYVVDLLARSPETSTMVGDHSSDHLLDDYSYKAIEDELNFVRGYLERFKEITPTDEADALALGVIIADLTSSVKALTSNHDMLAYGVFNSPMGELKEMLEFMPMIEEKHYQNLLSRLSAIPVALAGWLESLVIFQGRGIVNSKRNTKELVRQALSIFEGQVYTKFLSEIIENNELDLSDQTVQALIEAATDVDSYHYFLAVSIESQLLANSRVEDGVGSQAYSLFAQEYTYPEIDLQELYKYGLKEVESIRTQMHSVAREILPNYSSLREVVDYLNTHPNYKVVGKVNLVAKLRAFTDDAIASLNGVEFDIPEEILNVDILLNEESLDAAPYYTPPSEDLSRPGATWFPTMGKDEFTVWEQLSTWYHEGVPGHHLQCGTQALQGEKLTRYQKAIAWHSGYGEGWALYSERLMAELGFFVDPGYMFGFLQSQMLRAVRILVDLGLHSKLENPEGEIWSFDNAVTYLTEVALLDQEYAVSEINRYLSAPGQAISYKVGERVWLELRESFLTQMGEKADIKTFHAYTLAMGSVPLSLFKSEVEGWITNELESIKKLVH